MSDWEYEMNSWREQLGAEIAESLGQQDDSQPYEMDVKHLFKLDNGNFAVVQECGCSCYEARDADINVFTSEQAARDEYKRLCNV